MDISTPAVSPLRQRMHEDMRMRKFEPKTQFSYLRAVRNLAAFLKASPDTASAEDLRRIQMHMGEQGTSPITLNATMDRCDVRASGWFVDMAAKGGFKDRLRTDALGHEQIFAGGAFPDLYRPSRWGSATSHSLSEIAKASPPQKADVPFDAIRKSCTILGHWHRRWAQAEEVRTDNVFSDQRTPLVIAWTPNLTESQMTIVLAEHQVRASANQPIAVRSPTLVAEATAMPNEFLSFRLGGEEYGIDILRVQEIRGYEQPTRIAGAPDFIKGVVNLRGVIVPIVDMRIKFGIDDCAYDGSTVTIVLMVANRVMGIVVDSVSDVVRLKLEEIRAAPEFSSAVAASHIIGLGTGKQDDKERMLILVDIDQLMNGADVALVDAPLK